MVAGLLAYGESCRNDPPQELTSRSGVSNFMIHGLVGKILQLNKR
jgi:hypothetical protein